MAFDPQTFAFEEVLTSAKLNQTDTNIDEVRAHHKGSSAPVSPTAGTMWIDDSASPWTLNVFDGTDWISLGTIDPSANSFLNPSDSVDQAAVANSAVGRGELKTGTASTSGSVQNDSDDITLNAYAFFPMIHDDGASTSIHIRGHGTDGASADSPRFRIREDAGTVNTYDVDHRFVQA